MPEAASELQKWGAFAFGAVIGWNLYLINRYRAGAVSVADVATLITAIGGSAVLALFDPKTDLFGFYGIGLSVGFFAYFLVLLIMVAMSPKFGVEWFLDGRRKRPEADEDIASGAAGTVRPMESGGRSPR